MSYFTLSSIFFLYAWFFLMPITITAFNEPLIDKKTIPYRTIIKAWRHGESGANKAKKLSGGGYDCPLTELNENGQKQAQALGERLVSQGKLDIIYSSDLSRAAHTALAVVNAYANKGEIVKINYSKQLREILHGEFDFTDVRARTESGIARFYAALANDEKQLTANDELYDKYRFWKIHPQALNDSIVPELIVDVEDYIKRGEKRPETSYQLWHRIYKEFIGIAQENLGKNVGISMHGAGLTTLIEGLKKNSEGLYLPPHFITQEIKINDQLIMPAAFRVNNCDVVYFIYDSRGDGTLELYNQQTID